MILFMDSKTYLKHYVTMDPTITAKTQYIIVSSRIRKNGKHSESVINGNNLLFPNQQLIMDYDDYKYDSGYINGYMEQLEEALPFLATIVKYDIEESDVITVFLCSKSEAKYNYLELIQQFMVLKLDYYMTNYKKYLDKKDFIYQGDNNEKALKTCNKILEYAKEKKLVTTLRTKDGAINYIRNSSKKKLKELAKKLDIYVKGMEKEDLQEVLREYFEID